MDPLELHAFPTSAPMAEALARELGVRERTVEIHPFPDGESRVRVLSDAPRRAVVVCSLDDPNAKLVEVLLAADALRRGGAGSLTLVAPYLAYMRQDRAFREGEAVSQRVVGGLLGRAFDEVLTVEAHLHRIDSLAEVVPCRAASISAAPAVAAWLEKQQGGGVVVGPDVESGPWVRAIGRQARLDTLVCRKERRGDRDVTVHVPPLPEAPEREALERETGADAKPRTEGRAGTDAPPRTAWIVDDIASSGATLEAAARALLARGFRRVDAIVVHALFDAGTESRLRAAGVSRLVSTDTIPHATNAISVVPLLGRALESRAAAGGA